MQLVSLGFCMPVWVCSMYRNAKWIMYSNKHFRLNRIFCRTMYARVNAWYKRCINILIYLDCTSRNTSDVKDAVSVEHLACMTGTVLGVVMNLWLWSKVTKAVFIIILASFIPMQFRGPWPSGRKEQGGRPSLSSASNLQMDDWCGVL